MSSLFPDHPREKNRAVVRWLDTLLALIVIMVAIGGITRLTESGLSITEWNLITGVLPPLDEAAWQGEFEKYQASPEYQLRKQGMTLNQFKRIYFWEWLHRNWGRLIGVVYLLPLLVFLALRRVRGAVAGALLVGGVLLLAQGGWGWFMVKSGLVDKPFVSHYRLATHLLLALLLFSWLLWLRLRLWPDIGPQPYEPESVPLTRWLWLGLLLLVVQIAWGALVAGLDAGRVSSTYPLMQNRFLPPGLLTAPDGSGLRAGNLLDAPVGVHWLHRWLGTGLFLYLLVLWFRGQRIYLNRRQQAFFNGILTCVCLQFLLGIATVVQKVPLKLAVLHQVNAVLLLGAVVGALQALHAARPRKPPAGWQAG
jgi:cytochrome c oxidase assembly protein subunit 15